MEAVIVDAGSKLLKIGFASPDQDPALVSILTILFIMPTKMKRVLEDGDGGGDVSMVEEVTADPVVRGFIRDWDAMEDLLRHVLYIDLGWEVGDEGQILFAEPLFTPKAIREQLVQLMFETFNVSGFYASEQVVLSLYAVGRISGCTVDIGHGKIVFNYYYDMSNIALVCEGAVQHIASKRFQIGGIDLTNLLAQKLKKSNPLVKIDISEVEKLKEQYACCAEDQTSFEETETKCPTETHTLPDGQTITIGREGYIVGEALFEPSTLGIEEYGIVEQLVHSISSVSSENLRQLLENTMLCGGTTSMTGVEPDCQPQNLLILRKALHSFTVTATMVSLPRVSLNDRYIAVRILATDLPFLGFEERFQKEANLCSSSIRPSLIKPPEYMPENLSKNSAWMGGAILAKVVFPQNQHVTRGDYDETGPTIIHKKCF
ncbi:hypothetical protein ZIOFF_006276 [Zingiber officinale]|uniref:Actin-related protein 7 n=1 Tax=Zingiber officinale TaxID=94328 RepID=A0A8J5HRZ1_ZINOF|nr:hypothetical protein ZIOFF_006276 [Zingiber officinale]